MPKRIRSLQLATFPSVILNLGKLCSRICALLEEVSARAKKRGLPQMGTLGAGNHYAEIQVFTAHAVARGQQWNYRNSSHSSI
eukprot:594660-Amphidinium_carterae.1